MSWSSAVRGLVHQFQARFERVQRGLGRLHWDGRDDDRPLASGTYLYRLVTRRR